MKKLSRMAAAVMAGTMAISAVGCGSNSSTSTSATTEAAKAETAAANATYTGTGKGFGGDVIAEVTVDADGKIVDLKVTADNETPSVGGAAVEPMVNAILEAGSIDVDGVSGATLTSNAIKEAVQAALIEGGFAEASSGEISFTAGTYEGEAMGRGGMIHATVEVSDSEILSVKVTGDQETPGISDMPLEDLPKDIVTYQSLGVDSISGATLTSFGVINAVSNALESSGVDLAALKNVPVEKEIPSYSDTKTQVVVAGGGMAGLTAALEAAHKGADVILLEKLPMLGGSMLVSASGLGYADAKSTDQSVDDSMERHMAYVHGRNVDSVRQPNYDFLEHILAQTGETIDYLKDEFGLESSIFLDAPDYPRVVYGSGAEFTKALEKLINEAGVTVIKEATVDQIVMEDGEAKGVHVSHAGGDFTVNADKVIIATGGSPWNEDMLETTQPQLKGMDISNQASVGDTGDGYRMFEEAGAKMGVGPYLKDSYPDFWNGFLFTWATVPRFSQNLVLDSKGNRISSGNSFAPYDSLIQNENMIKNGSYPFYAIYDAENMDADLKALFDEHTAEDNANIVVYADTLDEIAEKTGMDAETLKKSYDAHMAAAESGYDDEFDKDGSENIKYSGNGYYAAYVRPGTWGTYGGAITDEQFHVLDNDGNIIPNLFGAGEAAGSEFFGDYYFGGYSLSLYSTAGRIAADTAVTEINQ